jgi:PiT family inorganic phosphate transporter
MIYIVCIVIVALVFDMTNGAHDAANSIATIVATKVLSPKKAVVWSATFNFVAFLVFGTAVAKTVGKGMIDISVITPTVILAGLLGAIAWNLITWAFGFPSSSSHALIGAYAGAAIAKVGGFSVVIMSGWIKPIVFIFLAPLIGFVLGALFLSLLNFILKKVDAKPEKVDWWSRKVQLFTAALYSLGHGGNDAQKTMGVITGLLFSAGVIHSFVVPFWVVLSAHAAIAIGTLIGAWKIVHTMGHKIVKDLRPIDGSCAETASALSLFLATSLGVPVSTTHVITGAIGGVGSVKGKKQVFWKMLSKIIVGWLLTIPAAGSIAWGIYFFISYFK